MKIQIITNVMDWKIGGKNITFSELSNPKTFDSFDINIIDLQDEGLWINDGSDCSTINSMGDFRSLQVLVESTSKAKVIIALPQNYTFYFDENRYGEGYNYSFILKNRIEVLKSLLSNILPKDLQTNHGYNYNLAFENATTTCGNSIFESAFYFSEFPYKADVTKADDSGKATTIKTSNNCFLTTLFLSSEKCKLKDFFDVIGLSDNKIIYPQWLIDYDRFDDAKHKQLIGENKTKIELLKNEIKKSNEQLNKNLRFKSILTENSTNLVVVIFDILEDIFSYDLSGFKDEKREDFLIELEKCTFIGEIKGINSNVKNENISQLEVHYQIHMDKLAENNKKENVKALLVINPQRNKPINERDEVHKNQIELAKRNGSLIIPTITLLSIYEKFLEKQITSEQIIELFLNQSGLIDFKI